MKIHPLDDRLVVEAIDESTTTSSGILIPDTAGKEKPQKGKVVAVGPGKMSPEGKRLPMSVKVGDTIVFRKYGPDEIKIDGKEVLILSESDVLAIVK